MTARQGQELFSAMHDTKTLRSTTRSETVSVYIKIEQVREYSLKTRLERLCFKKGNFGDS